MHKNWSELRTRQSIERVSPFRVWEPFTGGNHNMYVWSGLYELWYHSYFEQNYDMFGEIETDGQTDRKLHTNREQLLPSIMWTILGRRNAYTFYFSPERVCPLHGEVRVCVWVCVWVSSGVECVGDWFCLDICPKRGCGLGNCPGAGYAVGGRVPSCVSWKKSEHWGFEIWNK